MPSLRDTILKTTTAFLYANAAHVAGTCKSFASIASDSRYIIHILPSFVLAFIVWNLLERIAVFLNDRYDWMAAPLTRISFQLLGASMAAALLMVVMIFTISLILGAAANYRSDWLMVQAKVAIVYAVMVNLVMVSASLYKKLRETEEQLDREFPNRSQL